MQEQYLHRDTYDGGDFEGVFDGDLADDTVGVPFDTDTMTDDDQLTVSDLRRTVYEQPQMTAEEKASLSLETPDETTVCRTLELVAPPPNGRVLVNANESAAVGLEPDQEAMVLTGFLGGCTSAAAIITLADGSKGVFLSHTGPFTDNTVRDMGGDTLTNSLLQQFNTQVNAYGEPEQLILAIAYKSSITSNRTYGTRTVDYARWHFLDQLENTAAQWRARGAEVVMLPYGDTDDDAEQAHTMAAGADELGAAIYFDGKPVIIF